MTLLVPSFDDVLVVRETDAEVLGLAPLSTRLLANSDATGEALSIMRTTTGEASRERGPTRIASPPNFSTSWMDNCNCWQVRR